MRERFRRGGRVLLSGTPRFNGGRWEMVHPRVEPLEDDREPAGGSILPLYPLTEGLKQSHLRRVIRSAVDGYASLLEEVFPAEYLDAHGLLPIQTALTEIHAPRDTASLEQARRRFIYQELLVLQLALALRKQQRSARSQTPPLPVNAKIDARIRRLFPFELTPAQQQALQEITADMARPTPMNRLLQGDVGSGKTVVAEYSMLLAVAHGFQAALMAPTEILARQHAATLQRDLRESRVRIQLLTGSLSAAQRRQTLEQIAAGEADLIVGTHALLQEDIDLAEAGAGGHRRATQVRREPAGGAAARRRRPALSGHDGHADSAHDLDDAVRRLGRSAAAGRPAGTRGGPHVLGLGVRARPLVGVLPQEAVRGPAGLRDRAARRVVGGRVRGQRPAGAGGLGQRRAGRFPPGPDARPAERRTKRNP